MSRNDDETLPHRGRRDFIRTTAVVGIGVTVGCGGGADGDDPGDGGPDAHAPDAGAPTDAGPSADAGDRDGGTDAGPPEPPDPPEDTPESDAFPLSVASGDVTTETALLWTRYDGGEPLRVVVWEMEGDDYARVVHAADATAGEGGYVRHDASGLSAGRRYRYSFFEMDGEMRVARSPVGRLRAAIAADAMEPLTFGAVSCTDNGRSMDTLERASERDDIDLFLFLGDTTYNDGSETLPEYRSKWEENISTTGYRRLREATSLLATWDDHEFANDWNPETFDAAQLDAAVQAFFDHQPVRRDEAAPKKVWKRLTWGRTAEVFVLDCRSERLPSTRGDSDAIYVSREQMDWLKAGLADSAAVFKIIMNSVPIGDFPGAFDFPSARNDRWEGYAAQREEILRFVQDAPVDGVLWLSGDFHLGSMGYVAASGLGSDQVEVLAGPGAQIGNPLATTLGEPQFDWASARNNYTLLELDPSEALIRVWFVDGDGSVMETGEYRF